MSKFIPLLLCLSLTIASCAHNNLEAHFQESKTGWTKQRVFKKFGPPTETSEDTNFQYYLYKFTKPSVLKGQSATEWQVRYVFENNKVVDVIEERVPTAAELDKLDSMTPQN